MMGRWHTRFGPFHLTSTPMSVEVSDDGRRLRFGPQLQPRLHGNKPNNDHIISECKQICKTPTFH